MMGETLKFYIPQIVKTSVDNDNDVKCKKPRRVDSIIHQFCYKNTGSQIWSKYFDFLEKYSSWFIYDCSKQ